MGETVEGFKAKADLDKSGWNSACDSMKSKIGVFTRSVKTSFKNAKKEISDFTKGVDKVAKWGAAGFSAAAAGAALLVKKSADAGDELSKASQRTGLDTSFLSKIKYSADMSGTSIDDFEVSIRKMQNVAADAVHGNKTAADSFRQLGVSLTDSSGRMKSTETLFMQSAAALSKMQDSTLKAALAQDIFGKSGTALLPMLADGKQGLVDMMKESDQLGYTWTNETAKSAADLNDSMSRLWTIAGGMVDRFSVELFPAIQEVTDGVKDWYLANRELINGKLVEWAGDVKSVINSAWDTVSGWASDGTFLLWWERAKLAALGFKVALAGVQSALDFALAGYHRMQEAANLVASRAALTSSSRLSYEAAAIKDKNAVRQYLASAATRSTDAVAEYSAQARRVADFKFVTEQKQRPAETPVPTSSLLTSPMKEVMRQTERRFARPSTIAQTAPKEKRESKSNPERYAGGGGDGININIEVLNGALGQITQEQTEAIAEALSLAIERGRAKALPSRKKGRG